VKILFAIQGTGNGHVTRAEDVIPFLREYGELDLFVSGAQADVKLPYPVKYKSKGLSFFFGTSGGINFFKTFKQNFPSISTTSSSMILNQSQHGLAENGMSLVSDSVINLRCYRQMFPGQITWIQ
jgi:hypothetical protein